MICYDPNTFNPDTDLNWHFKTDDTVVFNTYQSDLTQYNGTECTVLRRVTLDEADLFELGPMYRINIGPVYADESRNKVIEAFEDELTATDWTRFVRKLDAYRALGYRIVAFEMECDGGWIMAFDTHGKDATEFPKEAFDVPAVRDWCRRYGWGSVTDDDVLIFDDTDDPQEIYGGYDYTSSFPVMQLAYGWPR